MKYLLLVAVLAVLFSSGCGSGNAPPPGTEKKLDTINVIVLLDLSDRVLLSEFNQIKKDQEIIAGILDEFSLRQRQFAFLASRDVIQVVVAPESGVQTGVNDSLRIDMTLDKTKVSPGQIGLPAFNKKKDAFLHALAGLYDRAATQANPGADIYTFFCSGLPAFHLSGNAKTKVIVLTDGYLLFDPPVARRKPECTYMRKLESLRNEKENWKAYFDKRDLALCPCQRNISNVEVLLLEVAPKNKGVGVHEFDIIEHYWQTWFDAMGVKASIYPHQEMVSNIRGEVREFLK